MSPPSPSVEALPTLAADHARSASDTPSLEKEPPDYDIEKDPGYSNDASDSKNLSKVAEVTELTPAEAFEVNVDGDESPFPEVNASVSTSDDPTSQINNFRMWFFVTLTTIIFAGCNMFFSLRYPSLSIGYTVAQILVHPLGRAWASAFPDCKIGYGRFSFRLNPGPWNMKEHGLIALCVNLTGSSAYAAGSLVAMTTSQYWDRKQDFGPAFGVLYILTTQMLGFGLAGLARRIIVYPAAMIWPSALPSTALFRALHEPEEHVSSNGWRISRYRFFCAVTLGSFVWFWFPDYIWQSLSTFAFACYIAPNNQKVNTVFGMNSGLGLIPISFDWTQITYAGQPLTTPFYITANCWAAVAIFFLGVAPILYYNNVWYSGYLPILSSSTFDNTGAKYNVTRVMTDNLFDLEKYRSYSPMYISMAYSLSYCLNFAACTSIFVHTFLYNRKQIWARLRNPKAGGEDIHQRLMRAYKEVPDWWYATLALVVLGLGIFTIRYWDTQLPVWGFIVVTWGMGVLLIVPEGILQGTTNQRVFLNIITELIAGYAWPGKPVANIMVKMYGYNSVKHGLDFAQDLKLVSYLKIPPRTAFAAQIYASVLSCVVQVGVLTWMQGNIKDLCSPTKANRFTCQGTKVVHNSSVIWGAIGPQRMFAAGETYSALLHFFWIGPVVTVLFYAAYRRWPRSWLRYVNVPIFFNSAGNIPPASCAQYSLWFITGFVFNYAIRRRAFLWWKKYNYLLSAALDTGTALATIIIFFALSYHGLKLVWWGNEVNSTTMDGKSTPWLTVAKGHHFGRSVGDF